MRCFILITLNHLVNYCIQLPLYSEEEIFSLQFVLLKYICIFEADLVL